MGNFIKWLGAGLGFSLGGPIGSILGFVVGNILDGFSKDDLEAARRISRTASNRSAGDFEISLLILSAMVIKSDGKIDERELNFVRNQFKQMYGEERASHAFKLFKGFMKTQQVSTRQVCIQIRENISHAARLQLIHFLFGIAKSDGIVTEAEVEAIREIAAYLYVNQNDYESIKAMFYDSSDSAYKILEIEKTASVDEIKKAYRRMVKKYHPDKLHHLGEEHLKGAEEKFKEVQKAYEKIQKERGF